MFTRAREFPACAQKSFGGACRLRTMVFTRVRTESPSARLSCYGVSVFFNICAQFTLFPINIRKDIRTGLCICIRVGVDSCELCTDAAPPLHCQAPNVKAFDLYLVRLGRFVRMAH